MDWKATSLDLNLE